MSVPGYRIGQAANLAHQECQMKKLTGAILGVPNPYESDEVFLKEWKERTRFHIEALNQMEQEFSDPEDWTDKKPEPKPTPVKLDFGDGRTEDINQ